MIGAIDDLRTQGVGSCWRDGSGSRVGTSAAAVWETLWLHTDNRFYEHRVGAQLAEKIMALARDVDTKCGWGMLEEKTDVNIRVVESHRYHGGEACSTSTTTTEDR